MRISPALSLPCLGCLLSDAVLRIILVIVLVLLTKKQSHCPVQFSSDTDLAIVLEQLSQEGT